MAAVGPIGGTAYAQVDGVAVKLKGDFKIQPSGVQHTGEAGMDGVHGFTDKVLIPSMEMKISDDPSLQITSFQNITNSTITAELKNGKTYVLANAWYAGDGTELDASAGEITLKFEGYTCTELLAQ